MKTLQDLWYGNITPIDMLRPLERAYTGLYNLREHNQKRLASLLNGHQKEILDELLELCTKLQLESQCDAFAVGFRLGVQLMTAALWDLPE